MKNKELANRIKPKFRQPEKEVLVKIEGGLYYPIKDVKADSQGNIVIVCRDVANGSVLSPINLADFKKLS